MDGIARGQELTFQRQLSACFAELHPNLDAGESDTCDKEKEAVSDLRVGIGEKNNNIRNGDILHSTTDAGWGRAV